MEEIKIEQIVEAIVFSADKPVLMNQIDEVLDGVGHKVIEEKINELNSKYERCLSPYRVKEIAGGYVLATLEEFAPWLKKLYKTQSKEKLSGPALESLSIIAYRQPVTKPDMEAIRGVNVDGVLKNLLEKGLIKINGRKDAPGRPFYYSTTDDFLKYFGLKSLKDLPPLEEFGADKIQFGGQKTAGEEETEQLESVKENEEKC